ncbi:FtsX-like permease family protein [Lachnospiraceae bacterium NE2001]|nr:FtsX-like permease family protein [Lachnospiraceae bacterium NE2001]
MFFRMIKKDLKESKGLNVIILLFMIMVSVLTSASALLLIANIRGVRVSQERCNPYAAFIVYTQLLGDRDGQLERYEELLTELYPDAVFEQSEGIKFDYTNIDYEGIDYNALNQSFGSALHFFMKQPRNMNLVYDINNKPFYVENGKIAIPYIYANQEKLKVGDSFFYTAPNGKKYEFEISYITRDPIQDNIERFILSDADYDFISKESPEKYGILGFQTETEMSNDDVNSILSKITKDETYDDYFYTLGLDGHTFGNSALVAILVTLILAITGVFMVLIVFFTIGFTIRSAIKKEERELGIMKALGTDSISFRWLVAAKYIAFSIVGGIIGALVGAVVGDKLIGAFYYNISYSLSAVDYIGAFISAAVITLLVILFILLSMRRINKISVMDVLHGESRSERIKHSDRFQLNRRGKMPLPLYLALSDIFGNFKRYVLLLIAFTIGSSVVIANIQMRESIISPEFLYKFYSFKTMDVAPNLSDSDYSNLTQNTGRSDIFKNNFDNLMREEDIALYIELDKMHSAQMLFGDEVENVMLNFGFDPEGMVIREGGAYPKLRNEVLIDYFTAENHNLNIGDSVTIEYDKYNEDRLGTNEIREEFVITGFVDRLSATNTKDVIMSKEFDDASVESWNFIGSTLDVPDSQKAAELEKLDKLFPDQMISADELIEAFLGMYDVLFSFMRNLMIVVVAAVLGFLVVMYQTIFMKDEEPEIALLLSSGFDDRSAKGWQFLRMMLLFVAGAVISIIFAPTVLGGLMGLFFKAALGMTGFSFTKGFMLSLVWVIGVTLFIAFVMVITLRKIRNIEIWRIRNE